MRQIKGACLASLLVLLLGMLMHINLPAQATGAPAFTSPLLEAYTGQTVELLPLLTGAEGLSPAFSSSNEEVIRIGPDGTAAVVGEGRARITAAFSDGRTAGLYIRAIDPVPARRALLLTEQRYTDGRTRTGAINSVQGLSDMLGALRYRSGTPFSVTVQIDSTPDSLAQAVQEAFSGAQSSDIGLIYISCHGETIDGEPCLLLHDGSALSVRALEAMLRPVPGRMIVLIDCCQSGSFIGSAASRLYTDAVAAIFSDSALLGGKYLVITSCGAEQDSYRISDTGENTEADMSTVFARALCEGLGWDLDNDRSVTLRADADRDGAVTFTELWLYTRRRVNYHLSGTGVCQTVMAWPDINEAVLFARQFS